jgi:hypothetical protein
MEAKHRCNNSPPWPATLTPGLGKRLEREARALGVSVDELIDWALLALADALEAKAAQRRAS